MKRFQKLFVAGTFDRFHTGHQFFLWQASGMCEQLVIIVARDKTVHRIKGRPSHHDEEARLQRIKNENIPHTSVRLGREDGDFFQTLQEESPDGLLLGYDQRFDEEKAKDIFPELLIIRAEAYKPEHFKSSKYR